MSGSLKALKAVAAIDSQIFELEAKHKQIPELLRKEDDELQRTTQELATKDAEIKDLRVKTELKEKEFQMAEEVTIRLRNQIQQAKSNKEFQALQHEILSKEADNARFEDTILLQMQKLDSRQDERKHIAEQLKKIDAHLADQRAKLGKEQARLAAQIDKLREQRSAAGKTVPADIFAKYERLIARRGQTAMVAVVNGSCQGCFMTMRPETMAQLKKATDLVTCHSCGRILYLED